MARVTPSVNNGDHAPALPGAPRSPVRSGPVRSGPVPERGLPRQLGAVLGDPATRRDLFWLLIDRAAGLILALLPVTLWLTVSWNYVLPGVVWAVLILSQCVERLYARELLSEAAGSVGYPLKDRIQDVAQFIDAIRRRAAAGTKLSP